MDTVRRRLLLASAAGLVINAHATAKSFILQEVRSGMGPSETLGWG
jgi:hypothetical protein